MIQQEQFKQEIDALINNFKDNKHNLETMYTSFAVAIFLINNTGSQNTYNELLQIYNDMENTIDVITNEC